MDKKIGLTLLGAFVVGLLVWAVILGPIPINTGVNNGHVALSVPGSLVAFPEIQNTPTQMPTAIVGDSRFLPYPTRSAP